MFCTQQNKLMKKLGMKKKIELSWNFLYKITEAVMNKFSKEDKEAVLQLGSMLYNNGMKYEHVVDLAIPAKQVRSKATELEAQKEEIKQRGV